MSRRSPWLLVLAASLLLPAALLAKDVIYKTDGGRLRGKILKETSTKVTIKTLGGTYVVPRSEIARIEHHGDVFRELEKRKKKLSEHDGDGWFKLGSWLQDQGLYPEAIDCFHHVLAIEPNHEDARWELGYRRLKDRWVSEATYFQAKGYVRWEHRWVSEADHEKLEAGLVKVDGHWVSRAEARKTRKARKKTRKKGKKRRRRKKRAAPDARRNEPGRRRMAFPWAGRNRPLGGQVGLPPLSKEQRKENLEARKQRGGWQVAHSTKYYDLYSNGPKEEVKKLGRVMDLMCVEFKKIFKFKAEITRPFPIHLYGSQREFMSRTGKGQGVGGFYDGRKIVGFHGKLGALSTQSVLFHEGTHQFQGLVMGSNMWRAKIWLIEGLAVFFEASKVAGRRLNTRVIPKARLAHVRRAISSGRYVRLHDLIRLDQRQFGALHYAHAWSLIHFLINGAKGGKKRFVEYWEKAKVGGYDPVKLFEDLLTKPMDEIEAAWKAYVLKLS